MAVPRIYPSLPVSTPLYFNHVKCLRLPESTHPSQNTPPFSTNLYVRPTQNLPLSPRMYPPFQQIYMSDPFRIYPPFQQIYTCDPSRIYSSLPEYSLHLFSTNLLVRPSQNLPLPPRIYSPFSTTVCDPPRMYPSLSEYIHLFNNYVRPSQNLPLPPRIYPPFSTTL